MYTIIIQHLYTLQRNHHHQSSFYPLPHSWLLSPIFPTPNPQFVYNYLYFFITLHSIGLYFHHQSHLQLGVVFSLAPSLHSFWVISPLISSSILGTYHPGELIFQYPIFLPFHTVPGVLKARILMWFDIPFSSGPRFVSTLHHDPSLMAWFIVSLS